MNNLFQPMRQALLAAVALAWLVLAPLGCNNTPEGNDVDPRENDRTNGTNGEPRDPFAGRPVAFHDEETGTAYTWLDEFDAYTQDGTPLQTSLQIEASAPIEAVFLDGAQLVEPDGQSARIELTLEPKRDFAAHGSPDVAPPYELEVRLGGDEPAMSRYHFHYVLDAFAPEIEFVSHELDEYSRLFVTEEAVEIVVRVRDDAGLAGYWLTQVREEAFAPEAPPLEATLSFELEVEQGSYPFELGVSDVVGRETSVAFELVCDLTPPRVWIEGQEVIVGEDPAPILSREPKVIFSIAVADDNGIANVEIEGQPLSRAMQREAELPEEAIAYEARLTNLRGGESWHRLVVTDVAGNTRSIRLAAVYDSRGQLFTDFQPRTDDFVMPPLPSSLFGVHAIRLDGPYDGSEAEVLRGLQFGALIVVLSQFYAVNEQQLRRLPGLAEEAYRHVYLRIDRWEERSDVQVFVAGQALISALDIVRIAQRARTWLTEGDPREIIGDVHGTATKISTQGRAEAATVDEAGEYAYVTLRQSDGELEVARLDLHTVRAADRFASNVRWRQVERLRTHPTRHALILIGVCRDGEPQVEFMPLDGAEPRLLEFDDGGLAFHPHEQRILTYDATHDQWLHVEVPTERVSYSANVLGLVRARAAGFTDDARHLVALATYEDPFGIVTPGALAVLDPFTGAIDRILEHQEILLATVDGLEPIASVDEGEERIAWMERRLHARVAESGRAALLSTADRAIVVDLATGEVLLRPLPSRETARYLGGRLSFEIDPAGQTAVVRGRRASLVIDVNSGLEIARIDHGFFLAEQHPFGIEVTPVDGGLSVQALRLPDEAREFPVPRDVPYLSRGADRNIGLDVNVTSERIPEDQVRAFTEAVANAVAQPTLGLLQRHGFTFTDQTEEMDGQLLFNVMVDAEVMRVMGTVIAPGARVPLGQYVLGTWIIKHNDDWNAAFRELAAQVEAEIEPMPERLFPLMFGSLDLPVLIHKGPEYEVPEVPEPHEEEEESDEPGETDEFEEFEEPEESEETEEREEGEETDESEESDESEEPQEDEEEEADPFEESDGDEFD